MKAEKRVVFLSPHPDDHLMCAGFMIKLRRADWDLGEILFTDGSRGGRPGVKESRAKQYQKACEFLDVRQRHEFGLMNRSNWEMNFDLDKLVDLVQDWRPTILIMPNPADYHPEHQIVSRLGMSALRHASIYKNQFRVPIVLFAHGFLPTSVNILIDISDVYELKRRLLEIYAEELADHMRQWVEGQATHFGYFIREKNMTGVRYGEAFSIPNEWPANLSVLFSPKDGLAGLAAISEIG